MEQMQIDWTPRARHSDPQTSHEAADRAKSFASHHRAKIFGALTDYGPMTPREISEVTGLDYVAIQRRGSEMEKAKLITRGPSVKDGQTVWYRT